jgi:hypothetical protein
VDHHGPSGEGSEGFAWESGRGVARGYYGEDRHAIIGGNSILAAAVGQETPPTAARSILARPSVAALYAMATLILSWAVLSALTAAHADRRQLATGEADWIWYSSGPSEPSPLRFFATREIALERSPARATAKVFVDREHALFVNGREVGRATQAPGDPLRLYRIENFLTAGDNRIAIEASSATGVGGILFSLDLDGHGRDALVSDGRWRVDLSREALKAGGRFRPMVWGRPPQPPWGYPRMPRPEEVLSFQSSVFSVQNGQLITDNR